MGHAKGPDPFHLLFSNIFIPFFWKLGHELLHKSNAFWMLEYHEINARIAKNPFVAGKSLILTDDHLWNTV